MLEVSISRLLNIQDVPDNSLYSSKVYRIKLTAVV